MSGVYKLSQNDATDRAYYARADGRFCIMFYNNWKVEACDHSDKAGAVGFLRAPPGVQALCPGDVGTNWMYYGQDSASAEVSTSCSSCCSTVLVTSPEVVLGHQVAGTYVLTASGLYTRQDGSFCLMLLPHWKIEVCDHADKATTTGFVLAPASHQPACPEDVGTNWRYYHDQADTTNPAITITCSPDGPVEGSPGMVTYNEAEEPVAVFLPAYSYQLVTSYPLGGRPGWPAATSWVAAELECMRRGGHLPSIHSQQDYDALDALEIRDWASWIGANDREEEGRWAWTDGSPWDWSAWLEDPGHVPPIHPTNMTGLDCALQRREVDWGGRWRDISCGAFVPYTCYIPNSMVGEVKKEEQFYLKQMIKLVQLARLAGVEEAALWEEARKAKTLYMSRELVSGGMKMKMAQMVIKPGKVKCKNGFLEDSHAGILANVVISKFSFFQNIDVNATKSDWTIGFALNTYLSLCPLDTMPVLELFKHIVATKSPETIIQSAINHIEPKALGSKVHNHLARKLLQNIGDFFNMSLGPNVRGALLGVSPPQVLGAVTQWELGQLMGEEAPYLAQYVEEVRACLLGDCTAVAGLLREQG